MYKVYVIRSEKDGVRYIGSGKDTRERLRRHNKGDYRFTKGHRPWQIIFAGRKPRTLSAGMKAENTHFSGGWVAKSGLSFRLRIKLKRRKLRTLSPEKFIVLGQMQ